MVSDDLTRKRDARKRKREGSKLGPVAQLVLDATRFPSGVALLIAGYQAPVPLRVITTGVFTFAKDVTITVNSDTTLTRLNEVLARHAYDIYAILLYRQGKGDGATDLGPNRTQNKEGMKTVGDVYDPALNAPGTLNLHTSFRR
jgi:hypothetical protein